MNPLSEPGSMAYGSSIRTLRGDLNNGTYKIEWSYSCCERKIFANIPQSNRKYEFFIKYLPCKKCIPAMGKKNKKIVSYVPFDKKGFGEKILYTTVLVHELKHLKKYKVEESYIIM